ncbi:MAG: metallophosphoesterase family protein [Pyrinomonadaceae bacterium]
MRKIVHLSDVHFGTADPAVTELVVSKINEIGPHVVVVSGDLTQRAKSEEFKQARAFLDRLPRPQIVVPGNHDVPLYNVVDRFLRKLDKYEKYITSDLTPTFIDEEIAIVGINTARSLTIKGGRISDEQIAYVQDHFRPLPDNMLKVVVTHHPFDLPDGHDEEDVVGHAERAMPMIADCGGDVFLAGHLHVSNIETTAKRYNLDNGRVALIIQAGTATSARVRGEPHSFNTIEFEHPWLRIERLECRSITDGFQPAEHKIYKQTNRGWERISRETMNL